MGVVDVKMGHAEFDVVALYRLECDKLVPSNVVVPYKCCT